MDITARKSWKPVTAGILNMVTGAINAMRVIGLLVVIIAVETWTFLMDMVPARDLPFVVPFVNAVLIILLVLSVIEMGFSVTGGVFALQRKKWGWALAGSIIAILGVFPLGVASTIFVALSKDEFE